MAHSKVFRRYACGLISIAALALCVCDKVAEYCGDGQSPFDFKNQFCFAGAAVDKCGGDTYDPVDYRCEDGRVVLRTSDVTWNADGGLPAPTQTSVNQGGSITAPEAMTKEGYTFGGWYTNADFTTAATFPIANVTTNMTLYARWTASYESVTLGGLTWMKNNLNIETTNSWCYEDCSTYGRLYTWAAAQWACHSVGWRLPTNEEWGALVEAAGRDTAAKNLKATSGWNNNGNGNDTYGFSALPGGGLASGGFINVGGNGFWWTATENGSNAYGRYMGYGYNYVGELTYEKNYACSVRCVQN